MSTAFHLQSNGQTEYLNWTLKEMLRIYATYHQDHWDTQLSATEFAYNNAKQVSTNHTLFELDCGQLLLTPITLATRTSNVTTTDEFVEYWNNTINDAKDLLMKMQNRQTKYANKSHHHEEYSLGDKVLLSMWNLINPIDKQWPTKKLSPKYIGLYVIIHKISPVTYKLDLPLTLKIHPVFHISLLKSYNASDNEFNQIIIPLPVIIINNEEEFEVKQILDKRTIHKKSQYLIK